MILVLVVIFCKMKNKDVNAVYSLDIINGTAGFNDLKHLMASLRLSVMYSKKNFKKVILYTNLQGKKIVEEHGIPFDEIDFSYDKVKTNPLHWSYIKVYTCSKQKEPFVHIDNDAFLWDGLPKEMLESDCGFQSEEYQDLFKWYKDSIAYFRFNYKEERHDTIDRCLKGVNYKNFKAFNCGIIYFRKINEDLLKEWGEAATWVCDVFSKENPEIGNTERCVFFEQFLVARLCDLYEMKTCHILETNQPFTHLLAWHKRSPEVEKKLRDRLEKEDKYLYNTLFGDK